jgi:hypothetical protein
LCCAPKINNKESDKSTGTTHRRRRSRFRSRFDRSCATQNGVTWTDYSCTTYLKNKQNDNRNKKNYLPPATLTLSFALRFLLGSLGALALPFLLFFSFLCQAPPLRTFARAFGLRFCLASQALSLLLFSVFASPLALTFTALGQGG